MKRVKSFFTIFSISIFILLFNTKCIFKSIIGVPCPGCGLTRAWISFINGNISEAFYWHPLFLMIPALAILILLYFKGSFIKYRRYILIAIVTIVGLYIIIYIVRMVILFPSVEPLDYNRQSFINRLINYK
ncbi:DUF2752 domain-containing protein [Clostridium sardiniense]|uniref:DUF2752 domain-containing protein n=1 Tax=Clostridium sardiniense TaxID=29369 RepID=A0ABS7L2V3_CLOSR|nr:DUF2752 domain-containing protein [Clostridium sardiniense]MDQ0462085.1 phosphoglycerol transferase MdoB-like AlkP superfamily enzyme [Clostridium sardiniense]